MRRLLWTVQELQDRWYHIGWFHHLLDALRERDWCRTKYKEQGIEFRVRPRIVKE